MSKSFLCNAGKKVVMEEEEEAVQVAAKNNQTSKMILQRAANLLTSNGKCSGAQLPLPCRIRNANVAACNCCRLELLLLPATWLFKCLWRFFNHFFSDISCNCCCAIVVFVFFYVHVFFFVCFQYRYKCGYDLCNKWTGGFSQQHRDYVSIADTMLLVFSRVCLLNTLEFCDFIVNISAPLS